MRFSSAFSSFETVFDYDTKATEIKDIELKMGAPEAATMNPIW